MTSAVPADQPPLQYLLTTTEIADLAANGNRSAIANWRQRHPDFPPPVTPGRSPLFEATAVFEWLTSKSSRSSRAPFAPPDDLWWWGKAAEAFRGRFPPAAARSYVAALVLLHGALNAKLADTPSLPGAWTDLVERANGAQVVAVARDLERESPLLHDLLLVPFRELAVEETVVVELVRRLDAANNGHASDLLALALGGEDIVWSTTNSLTTTANDIARLIATAIVPDDGRKALRVLDPATGEGGLLVECARLARQNHQQVQVLGQEIDAPTWRIARTALLLERVTADLAEPGHDSIADDQWPNVRADLVVVDPPIAPPAAPLHQWVLYATSHLADDGRAAIALPANALAQVSAARRKPDEVLRTMLGELARRRQIEAVIVLPRRVRPDVVGPLTIWILRVAPSSEGQCLVISMPRAKRPTRASTQRTSEPGVTPIDIEAVAETLNSWRHGGEPLRRPHLMAREVPGERLLGHIATVVDALESAPNRLPSTSPDQRIDDLRRQSERLARSLSQRTQTLNELADELDVLLQRDDLWRDQTEYWRLRELLEKARRPS